MKRSRWIALVLICAGAYLLLPALERGPPLWLIFLPSGHDPRLVGGWITDQGARAKYARPQYFFSDGTGSAMGAGRLEWGSEKGQIAVKYAGTDYTGHSTASYQIDASGAAVTFAGAHSLVIPTHLKRLTGADFDRGIALADESGAAGIGENSGAMLLARERYQFFNEIKGVSNSGYRFELAGSRHWVLFPQNRADRLYFVDFKADDGSLLVTAWDKPGGTPRRAWQIPMKRGRWDGQTGALPSLISHGLNLWFDPSDEKSHDWVVAEPDFEDPTPLVYFEAPEDGKPPHRVTAGIQGADSDWRPSVYTRALGGQIAILTQEHDWPQDKNGAGS
jgi:hypothetical protein